MSRNRWKKKPLQKSAKVNVGKNKRMISILFLFIIAAILVYITKKRDQKGNTHIVVNTPYEPPFIKEGELYFVESRVDTISRIVIEIADTDYDRAKGLMYRRSMPDSIGMLFVFEEEKPQEFWMMNTYFSLDIIYISSKYEIVSIQKYTQPFSKLSLPSKAPARYVLEVNAGYCDSNLIMPGSRVAFVNG